MPFNKPQQRLQGLETDFPCASWLPLIYQNPNASPPVWKNSIVKPLWKSLRFIFICILLPTGIVMGMRSLGGLQGVELIVYDTMMQLRSPELIDQRIVVIEITEEDTSRYQYPIPDDILAKAINKLNLDQSVAVGVDLHRYYPRGKGREKLIELFNKNPQVITVCTFDTQDKNYAPPPEVNPSQLAFSNLMFDDFPLSGEKVRRQLLSYDPKLAQSSSSCMIPYSLSLTLAYSYLKHKNIQPIKTNSENNWQLGETILPRLPARFGGYQKLDGSSQIMINYRYQDSPDMRFRSMKSFTMSDVLADNIDPQFIKDKIILIGYSSPTAKDYSLTPMGEIPGVWIHAQMTSQVISTVLDKRPLIWAFSQWGDFLLVLGFSTVTTMVILGIKGFYPDALFLQIFLIIIFSIPLFKICLACLEFGLWLPFIPSILASLLACILQNRLKNNHEI
ncbi:CHASE2 domain-containing protein [Aphanothece sacrum]|uniref:CHASE2 domain-containing protein n=1 Tax=Aphanothece sacrum TaxID=1122 RepID=UPI000F619E0D|nr:CHASE2 domain-containing protein [Aphanothece sacrum]